MKKNYLNKLQILFHQRINNYLQSSNRASAEDFLEISKVYKELLSLKDKFSQEISFAETKKIKKFQFEEYKFLSEKYKQLDFLSKQIQKKANHFIDYFLVHGSYATKDFIKDWSDLDTIIILNDKIFREEKVFKQARKFFQRFSLICYKFDLLAHHRFIFLTNFDLNYYPQSILPLVVYDKCFDLVNKFDSLTFKVRNDYYEKRTLLNLYAEYFNNIQKKKITFWQYKKALAMLLMLPSLLLQSKNIYVYKKDSFQLAKKKFSQFSFNFIDIVSRKRTQWRLPWHSFYLNKYLIWFLPIDLLNFLHKLILYPYAHFELKNKEIKFFLKEASNFSQEVIKLAQETIDNFYGDKV